MSPEKNKYGELIFNDFPDFKPNKTPKEMFLDGIMEGGYFRPIYSSVTKTNLSLENKKYKFLKKIPDNKITNENGNKKNNKYNVSVGSSLEFWESKSWIIKSHPYGWIHWYCDFYSGIRGDDDERQIKRWMGVTGKNGRFKKNLIRQVKEAKTSFDDYTISPKIRQTLLHWSYELTENDVK